MSTTFDLCVGCLTGESTTYDYFCADCRDRRRELQDRVLNAPLRDVLDTGAGPLTVVQRTWPLGTTVEQVLASEVRPESVLLTSDGRGYYREALQGEVPPIETWVYVERWSDRGREFHGYIDPISRRIVQWG